FQAEDGIRDFHVTGVQTCALPIYRAMINAPVTAPTPEKALITPNAPAPACSTLSTNAGRIVLYETPKRLNTSAMSSSVRKFGSRSEERRVGKECRSRWGRDD